MHEWLLSHEFNLGFAVRQYAAKSGGVGGIVRNERRGERLFGSRTVKS